MAAPGLGVWLALTHTLTLHSLELPLDLGRVQIFPEQSPRHRQLCDMPSCKGPPSKPMSGGGGREGIEGGDSGGRQGAQAQRPCFSLLP